MIKLNPISVSATSQQYAVEITENLCQPFCLTNAVQPQGNVVMSIGETKVSGGVAYVELLATGSVVYQPKCGGCNSKVKQFSERVWLGFVGDGVPTVTLTVVPGVQQADNVKCCNTAYGWTMVQSVTVSVTFPS